MSIEAKILADSKSIRGERITTFLLTFPRIILAEFNTHRMFSRNSASSRAIPFSKMAESVQTNPFIPIAWMKDHKGMQGTEYLDNKNFVDDLWLDARDAAVKSAEHLHRIGLTKQLCNRLLEPFMWHTVICTATEYDNFFKLRDHEAAEIHIQELAKRMKEAMNNSTPKVLKVGEWHIPFGDNLQVATAKCARVSYTTVGSTSNSSHTADIELYNRLVENGHKSPLEHSCQVASDSNWYYNIKGFKSLRYIVENE